MSYLPTSWVNDGAPALNATNLNHLEGGLSAVAKMVFNVRSPVFGAVGNGIADDAAAIQSAIDAAYAAGGGIVYFPPGSYRCTAEITYKFRVELWGSGWNSTTIIWATDLGVGKYGLKPALTPEMATLAMIKDMTLWGPGNASLVLGTRSINMNGIRLSAHSRMENVKVLFFGEGVVIMGDHQIVRNVKAQYNYIGVNFETFTNDWATGSATAGDQHFVDGEYTFNARAGVSCQMGNVINGALFSRLHMGFQPYGFWRGSAAHTNSFLVGCTIEQCTFEDIGNALFKDLTTVANDSLSYCNLDNISTSGQFAATHKIASESVDALFWMAGAMYGTRVRFGYPNWLMAGMTRYFTVGLSNVLTTISGLPLAATPDVLWYGGAVPGPQIEGVPDARMQFAPGVVSQGDLVALKTNGHVERLTSANMTRYLGVAVTDANNSYLPVAAGRGGPIFVRSEVVTAGDLLRPLAGTEHHATSAGSNPIIGMAGASGGAGGGAVVAAYLK